MHMHWHRHMDTCVQCPCSEPPTTALYTPSCFAVKRGDRVAQLVLEKIAVPDVEEVEELDSTNRGGNGYGSTGVAAS